MEETPDRASLEKLGCRTPTQLHAGGVGRQQHNNMNSVESLQMIMYCTLLSYLGKLSSMCGEEKLIGLSNHLQIYIYIYIYYRFIVRFPIGLDFLFITFTFLLHFLLSWTSFLSISCSAISASTLSNHVFHGLPTGLLPSTVDSIHFFTQSSSPLSSHVHTISVYHF